MWLSLALLVLGAISTLSAFGGETWRPGTEPLGKRITRRGWVSLTCLTAALIFGVLKENRDDATSLRLAGERDEAQRQLKAANNKLDQVSSDLIASRNELSAQTALLVQERDEARNQLNSVSSTLGATRSQLSKQTEINLLTTLARQSPIRDSAWWVEFTSAARDAKDLMALYFSRIPVEYRPIVEGEIRFHPFLGLSSHIVYRYSDSGRLESSFKYVRDDVAPKIQPPSFLDDTPMGLMRRRARPNEPIISIISQRSAPSDKYISAAIAYRDLARRKAVATVTLTFRREFASQAEVSRFLESFRATKPYKSWHSLTDNTYDVEFIVPPEIRSGFARYWHHTFLKSSVHLYLENEASLMMSSSVGLGRIQVRDSSVALEFVAITAPQIRVGIEEF